MDNNGSPKSQEARFRLAATAIAVVAVAVSALAGLCSRESGFSREAHAQAPPLDLRPPPGSCLQILLYAPTIMKARYFLPLVCLLSIYAGGLIVAAAGRLGYMLARRGR